MNLLIPIDERLLKLTPFLFMFILWGFRKFWPKGKR
jgi:hypothetical protein